MAKNVEDQTEKSRIDEHFGEIKVFVQMYKGIPYASKVTDGKEEKRFGLPEQFIEAVKKVQQPG